MPNFMEHFTWRDRGARKFCDYVIRNNPLRFSFQVALYHEISDERRKRHVGPVRKVRTLVKERCDEKL